MALTKVSGFTIGQRTIQANNIGLYAIAANNLANGVVGGVSANSITPNEIETGSLTANLFANTLATMNVTKMNTSVQNVVVFNSTHIALGNVAGAATINTQQGTYFSANTSGGCTWSFTGGADSSKATGFTLELTSGAGNTGTAYTQTWPTAVKWPGGTAPTLTRGETAVDVLIFLTDDGGTNWRGALSIANSA